ncbi:amino acid permease/ SLC12A domain-containing protein [Aspergillus pseudodeflectus]|uniref:Amino acid permease/ SLC12A domain-containing protein n=1 Tax=Aspergillus pseudodeflectus TaxID=176178 RepID=A0ABR4KHB0_9EURO
MAQLAPPVEDETKTPHVRPAQEGDSIALGDATQQQSTQRALTSRHAIFIAWGGTVGTGLFITTGKTLATGGPAFLVSSYVLLSIFVYSILTGITEYATYLPVRGGSMSHYGTRFVSRSLGFAMSLLYIYSFSLLVPFELVATALIIDYWNPGVNNAVWISILLVLLVTLNVLPVRFYGEAEFVFAGVKLLTIVGLLLLSFILFWGGGPSHERLGFHYWKDPGATKTLILDGDKGRLIAVIATMISSALPFTFTPEMVVGTAGEIKSPRKNIPKVKRHFLYRLIVFFVGSTLGVSVICPSSLSSLTSGGSDASSSPWVAGIQIAGIHGLDSVINAVALVSAFSAGNAFLYLASRGLYTMALEGSAPAIFKRCTSKGVPIYAVATTASTSLLAYMSTSASSSNVLNWLLELVNTGAFLSWVCCSVIYLRFRRACDVQGVPRVELEQRSWMQPYASWLTIFVFGFLTLLNGFTVFFPGQWSLERFLPSYIGLPVFVGVYLGHRVVHWREPWAVQSELVDFRVQLEEEGEEGGCGDREDVEGARSWLRRVRNVLSKT